MVFLVGKKNFCRIHYPNQKRTNGRFLHVACFCMLYYLKKRILFSLDGFPRIVLHMPLPPEAVLTVPPVHVAAVHPGHKVVGAALFPVGQALKHHTGETNARGLDNY